MRITILGRLAVVEREKEITPGAPKVKQVLALLAVRANWLVSLDSLIQELWEGQPPRSAMNTARTYIYQLRKSFSGLFGEARVERLIQTREPGYVLDLHVDSIDVADFDTFRNLAKEYLAEGDTRAAGECAVEALKTWRGAALGDVRRGPLLRAHATKLEDQRLAVLQLRIHADLAQGKYRELVGELRALAAEHPFDEWFHAQLMVALAMVGRRNDALRAYREIRSVLNEELGMEPSAIIQHVHQAILADSGRIEVPLLEAV